MSNSWNIIATIIAAAPKTLLMLMILLKCEVSPHRKNSIESLISIMTAPHICTAIKETPEVTGQTPATLVQPRPSLT